MNTIISTFLLLSTLAALVHTQGINILPQDAATELKECASAAGWYAANIRKGYSGTAAKANVKRHTANFKEKMAGIISSGTIDNIKDMFVYSSWYTANTRKGYSSDARRDRKRVNSEYNTIKNSGELSDSLIKDIHDMGWAAAWYAANKRAGYNRDAGRDEQKFTKHFDRIKGTVELVSVNFMTSDITERNFKTAPKVVIRKRLPNCGSTQLQTVITYEESIGETVSFTREVGFEYTITAGFLAGFSFLGLGGEVTFETSFTFFSSSSFSESIEHTRTRSYTFILTAAPYTTNTGVATVYEATGSVPYEMVFDFQGVRKTVHGTWTGVAVSDAIFRAKQLKHTTCTQ